MNCDSVYEERNRLVALLARMFPSGCRRTAIESWDPEWHNCVYIDFPWGQASWHFHDRDAYLFEGLPEYQGQWDGHTTQEKYEDIFNGTRTHLFYTVWSPHPAADRARIQGAPGGKAKGGEGFFGAGPEDRRQESGDLYDGDKRSVLGHLGLIGKAILFAVGMYLMIDGVMGLMAKAVTP